MQWICLSNIWHYPCQNVGLASEFQQKFNYSSTRSQHICINLLDSGNRLFCLNFGPANYLLVNWIFDGSTDKKLNLLQDAEDAYRLVRQTQEQQWELMLYSIIRLQEGKWFNYNFYRSNVSKCYNSHRWAIYSFLFLMEDISSCLRLSSYHDYLWVHSRIVPIRL